MVPTNVLSMMHVALPVFNGLTAAYIATRDSSGFKWGEFGKLYLPSIVSTLMSGADYLQRDKLKMHSRPDENINKIALYAQLIGSNVLQGVAHYCQHDVMVSKDFIGKYSAAHQLLDFLSHFHKNISQSMEMAPYYQRKYIDAYNKNYTSASLDQYNITNNDKAWYTAAGLVNALVKTFPTSHNTYLDGTRGVEHNFMTLVLNTFGVGMEWALLPDTLKSLAWPHATHIVYGSLTEQYHRDTMLKDAGIYLIEGIMECMIIEATAYAK